MLIWKYPTKLCAPHQSSNFRELDTVSEAFGGLGEQGVCRGHGFGEVGQHHNGVSREQQGRGVHRIIPWGSWGSGRWTFALCRPHHVDIDLVAVYIPGVLNTLADRGSRFKRTMDNGDWMLSSMVFAHPCGACCSSSLWCSSHLDGGPDAVGNNRQLHRFCSVVDSSFYWI